MKKTIIISIAAILVAAIALGAVGYLFWDKNKAPNEDPIVPENSEEVIIPEELPEEANTDVVNNGAVYAVRGVRMMASAPMTVSEDTMVQTISATVIPTTASNRAVDWSIAWANPNGDFEKSHNVTDYVTVTPASDGSTDATVTAHQAFPNAPVVITVTTRIGGFKAESIVRYIGIPTAMQILDNGEFDAQGRYAAHAQNTTNFAIDLTNLFDVVTDEYINDFADFEIVSIQAMGSITCSGKQFNSFLNMWMPTNTTKEVKLADIMTGRFSAEIIGGNLVITAGNPIESYSFIETLGDGGTGLGAQVTQYSYASGVENCYFILTIKDNYTGLTSTAHFYISCETSGVTLDAESLLF